MKELRYKLEQYNADDLYRIYGIRVAYTYEITERGYCYQAKVRDRDDNIIYQTAWMSKEYYAMEDGLKAARRYILNNNIPTLSEINSVKSTSQKQSVTIEGWVARNMGGPRDLSVRVYTVKPDRMKSRNEWNGHGEKSVLIDHRLFPDLKWEDEPKRCKITIEEI